MATYSGTAGDDVYSGGSEDDVIEGFGGNDTLSGGDGHDEIDGGEGDDIIDGGAGNDLIDSGTGIDRADGGSGVDGIAGDLSALSFVWWNLNANTFLSNSQTASFANFEYFAALITGAGLDLITTRTGAYDDDVTTGAGDDTVTVYNGHDTVRTGGLGEGNDTLVIDYSAATTNIVTTGFTNGGPDGYSGTIGAADRSVTFTGVDNFTITTGSGNDVIQTSGGDQVSTNAGDDFVDLGWSFNSGSANGGAGIDGISVDLTERTVAIDWNFATGSFKKTVFLLQDLISEFEYIGTLVATSGDDRIVTAGIDRDEVIIAANGNDSVTVVHGLDRVEGGSGTDILTIDYRSATGSVVSGALTLGTDGYSGRVEAPDRAVDFTGIDRLTIMSGSGVDDISGGDGNDILDGGAGADEMAGGKGDDVYTVDDAGDVIVENAGEGVDEIRTALASYSLLGTEVEKLTATSAAAHQFRGSTGNNVLTGHNGNDVFLLQDGGEDQAFGSDGNDVFYFGASAPDTNDVANGGAGRDSLVLQGNVSVVLKAYNLNGIESISLQSGANSTFGDTANNFYDFDITTADGNVGFGQQLIVNAQSLRAGEDFTFDGSAETNGKFLVYGGHGVDLLTGGAGVDVFFFEGSRWGSGDRVDGGGGRDAIVISAGTGTAHIEFAADSLTSIESISVNATYATDPGQLPSYEFVLDNGNVAPGGTLIVNGFSLANSSQTIDIDGSAVHDGHLILFGGAGSDTLIGGDGNDQIYGAGLGDALTGGAGADTFRYDAAADSTAAASDLIEDFVTGTDKVDLSRIDANTLAGGNQAFTWIGGNAFAGAGASSAGELRLFQDGGGIWHAEADTNGDGNADLVILFQTGTAAPVQSDFLL